MSNTTPGPDDDKTIHDVPGTQAATPSDENVEVVHEEVVVESTPVDEPEPLAEPETRTAAETRTVTEERAPAGQPVQTVFVTAPVPPKKKGNRGVGTLLAILAVIVYGAVFTLVMAIILNSLFPGEVLPRLGGFLSSSAFLAPVLFFAGAFILLVLIVNRAGWGAYIIGSFIVALVVYFGSIGFVLLTFNVFGMTPDEASAGFLQLAGDPAIIVAAILAREVAIWFGAAIAARGRRVKQRNVEARESYDRELAEQWNEYGRA